MTMTAIKTYEELVARGREAREQADEMQWLEGDLALEVEALPGDERPRDPETGLFIADETTALKRYAEDVGVNYAALKAYRRTAAAWPSGTRVPEAPWFVHRVLAPQDDRCELIRPGMTGREAERLVQDRRRGAPGKPGWFELLGHVGDTLIKAEKHLDKIEEAVTRKPSAKFQHKANEYATWADDLARRLRDLAEVQRGGGA